MPAAEVERDVELDPPLRPQRQGEREVEAQAAVHQVDLLVVGLHRLAVALEIAV